MRISHSRGICVVSFVNMDISIKDAIFLEMVLRCMIYWLSTVKCILINACQKFYVNDCDQNLTFCDGFFFFLKVFSKMSEP